MERGYANCQIFIEQFQRGELQLAPGCTAEETLEVRAVGVHCGSSHEA